MRLSTKIEITFVLVFFLFPILTNFAGVPEEIKPKEASEIIWSAFQYWVFVIKMLLQSLHLMTYI